MSVAYVEEAVLLSVQTAIETASDQTRWYWVHMLKLRTTVVDLVLRMLDGDGVCDDIDDCVGEYDSCQVCNGPGDIYECGCADIPQGDCDCDGDNSSCSGCPISVACNYDS